MTSARQSSLRHLLPAANRQLRRVIRALPIGVFACLLAPGAAAQSDYSNRGRDFWVGYGHHQYMELAQSNAQDMVLYLSAEQAANVKVTVKGAATTTVTNYSVPANTTITTATIPKANAADARLFSVPPSLGGTGNEAKFNRGIHIESDVPIVAYAHIYASVASGATMLLPTESWGYAYTSMNSEQVDAGGPAFSWLYVLAKDSNTVVEITPSVVTSLGRPAGVPFQLVLNKGEIYQILGTADAQGNGSQLTGTRVRSVANNVGVSYPIAVFSGSSRTRGETACGTGSGRDNDMQQAFPAQAWGTRYLTAPFSSASGTTLLASTFQTSVYKIVPRFANTTVRRNGVLLPPLSTGWYQFSSNGPELIEADKPVMVGQFMSGGATCNPGGLGDPEMVYLTALDQGITGARFFRNNKTGIAANYATVIVPAAGLSSLQIDGSSSFNYVYDHPRLPGYKIAVKGWAAAQASVEIRCDSAFTALTYGLGSAESYGYNVGVFMRNLDLRPAIQPNGGPLQSNSSVQAGAPFRFALRSPHRLTSLTWKLSAVPGLSPATDVTVANPVPFDSTEIFGRTWYGYVTDATYTAATAGTFNVPVTYSFPLLELSGETGTLDYPLIVTPGIPVGLNGPFTVPDGLDASSVHLSPNPVRGELRLRYSGRSSGSLSATLLTKLGTPTGHNYSFTGGSATLNLEGLPAGTYILVLRDIRTGKSVQKQVVKL